MALLVEVSDSSLRFDRTVKLELYAATGIPEVWVVDLLHRQVLVWRDPIRTAGGTGPSGRSRGASSSSTPQAV